MYSKQTTAERWPVLVCWQDKEKSSIFIFPFSIFNLRIETIWTNQPTT